MATNTTTLRSSHQFAEALSHAGIVGLTLATALIHLQLGGLLFTANAVGYATFAGLMVAPGPAAHFRWLVRLGLLGFTTVTIVGWLMFGARFQLAYIDKAIELVVVGFVLAELWLVDGGPRRIAARAMQLFGQIREVVAQ